MQKTSVWALFFLIFFSPLGFPLLAGAQIFNSQEPSLSLQPNQVQPKVWDPLESSNRKVFHFNDVLYTDVVKPVTVVYKKLPAPVRKVVHNGFQNLEAPSRVVNLVLQGKPRRAGNEMTRFMINSTVGVGGMFDVAHNALGIKEQDADFGQTLGVWSVTPGPYLVVPVLGPSDTRDLFGYAVDSVMDPLFWVPGPIWVTWPADCVKYTSKAAEHIDQYEALKRASLDPYVAIRDAYMQHREDMIGVRPLQAADIPAGASSGSENSDQRAAEQAAARVAQAKAFAQARAAEQIRVHKPRRNATPRELAEALRKAAENESSSRPFEAVLQEYPQLAGAVAARDAIAHDAAFRPDWGQDNKERLSLATDMICSAVARGDRFTEGRRDSRLEKIREMACNQQRDEAESEQAPRDM